MDAPNVEEWLASANEVIEISILNPITNKPLTHSFNPTFTYFFLEDAENDEAQSEDYPIFGYKDLDIQLKFRAHDLKPRLQINYSERFSGLGENQALALDALFANFLPPASISKDEIKPADVAELKDWTPPGKKIKEYRSNGTQYEIWCAPLSDRRARDILRNMQILVPFYIEGGTCQELDDENWTMERWKLFLLYEVHPSIDTDPSYHTLTGFCTTYRSWVFPTADVKARLEGKSLTEEAPPTPPAEPTTRTEEEQERRFEEIEKICKTPFNPLETASRERISQFLILPPYGGQGHGSRLYETIVDTWLDDKYVFEFTVEDPNEEFDRLRDLADLKRLRAVPDFAGLDLADTVPDALLRRDVRVPISSIIPFDTVANLRVQSKISPRQFSRLMEMQLLSKIPRNNCSPSRITRKHKSADANDRKYFFWRLVVKERVYVQHRDVLVQLDKEERVVKVEETVEGIQEEYEQLIETAADRARRVDEEDEGEKAQEGAARKGKKRRVVVDDEEDDDTDASAGKKQRKR